MIELGGNIKLQGFDKMEPSKLIVVKKIVGNYAKEISDKLTPFQELSLSLNLQNDSHELLAKIITNEMLIESKSTHPNLFFAIDRALSNLKDKLKKP